MSTKIKALFCLFLVGILVGACGRKFRAIDENKTIEARADLLAKLHFASLFDSQQKYQDHVQLKSELMALEVLSDAGQGGLGIAVRENDCTTLDAGSVQYTNEMIFGSVTPGNSIPIAGTQNYRFHAVCIPTSFDGKEQCAHFLVAIQKVYAEGRVGAALAVVGIDQAAGNWRNLELSGNFQHAVNLRTFDQLKASFSCSQDNQQANFQLPQNQQQQGTNGQAPSLGDQLINIGLQAGLGWLCGELDGRYGLCPSESSTSSTGGTTPPINPQQQQPQTQVPTTTQPSNSPTNYPGQFDEYPQNGGGYDTYYPPITPDQVWNPNYNDISPNPFGNDLKDVDEYDEYCYYSGTCV